MRIYLGLKRSGIHAIVESELPKYYIYYNNVGLSGEYRNVFKGKHKNNDKHAEYIYVYENHLIANINKHIGKPYILILRDFKNMMSSTIKYHSNKGPKPIEIHKKTREYWKEHARVALDGDSLLSRVIYYPLWCKQVQYKKIPHFGGGSSFTRRKFQEKGHKMKTFQRYKKLNKEEKEKYNKIEDGEVRELQKRLDKHFLKK